MAKKKRGGIGSHTRPGHGKSTTYLTPPELLKVLGPFDLDPCCPTPMPWKTATRMYQTPHDDGLFLPWKGRVWLNPPYDQTTVMWLKLMYLRMEILLMSLERVREKASQG